MMKRRVLSLAVAACMALSAPGSAMAAPAGNDGSLLMWDGPITVLDWRGHPYAMASDSFVGTPLAVPGDQINRRATVVNNGPAAARATIEIVDVTVVDPIGVLNTELQDCLHLTASVDGQTYDATWRQAVAEAVDSVSWRVLVPLAKGASLSLNAGAYFPVESTQGRSQGAPSQELSFKVRVTLVGDTVAPNPEPAKPDPPKPYVPSGGTVQAPLT